MRRKLPNYSGNKSKDFWRRINAIKGKKGELLYSMGCTLQNLEWVFLHAERMLLNELEEQK